MTALPARHDDDGHASDHDAVQCKQPSRPPVGVGRRSKQSGPPLITPVHHRLADLPPDADASWLFDRHEPQPASSAPRPASPPPRAPVRAERHVYPPARLLPTATRRPQPPPPAREKAWRATLPSGLRAPTAPSRLPTAPRAAPPPSPEDLSGFATPRLNTTSRWAAATAAAAARARASVRDRFVHDPRVQHAVAAAVTRKAINVPRDIVQYDLGPMEDGDEGEVPAVPRAPNAADTAYLDAAEAVRPRADMFLPAALRDPPAGFDAGPVPADVPLLALPPLPDPPTCLIPRPTTPPRGRRGRPPSAPPPPVQPTDGLAWSVLTSAMRRERARLVANEEDDLT
ncbi:hypothetical protein AMAG_01091 [Allomyces macrogynus ATCC 38327]|uniref:Uncharacterized protein n=1 Tax=Allomyces macrogynus (strain ATCC 38327) TaxID=578462 RepID=A0A0L0RXR6_ALLM3|nr:hypothetical protein AMAG_01091 [Allomyces macrogynus ATCC 38327]|eukprot:KNE55172.1 hypothetical protein AMAG_01091 [Allomyces macrogynus ATCC 38327]